MKWVIRNKNKNEGFTIIELIVVVVVIGVLAAITIVSYSGLRNKAIIGSIQVSLEENTKLLKMYYAENGLYPNSLDSNYCPNSPIIDNRYCLKPSAGHSFLYTGNNNSFELVDDYNDSEIAYKINESGVFDKYTPPSKVQLSTGGYHTCIVGQNGQPYCWGSAGSKQLGDNTTVDKSRPTAVLQGAMPSLQVKKIVPSWVSTCALTISNSVYCWGQNSNSETGDNTTVVTRGLPVATYASGVLNGLPVVDITAGSSHFCAIASDSKAYCWGSNSSGQIGNNSTTRAGVPAAVNMSGVLSGLTVKSITAGETHTCIVASDDNAYCWGANDMGQLGDGTNNNSSVPVAVNRSGVLSGLSIKKIASGVSSYHTCVIASNDKVYCWGKNNAASNLGDGSTTNKNSPVAVNSSGSLNGLAIKNIGTGSAHSCAIASDDKVYCWGHNAMGQIGDNTTTNRLAPTPVYTSGVLGGKQLISVSLSYRHTCAVSSDSKQYCWGMNSNGQLGDTTTINKPMPVEVTSI